MARGINKVILVGNLGADPEVRMTPGNLQIVRANIATSSGWKDKQTGEMQEKQNGIALCFSIVWVKSLLSIYAKARKCISKVVYVRVNILTKMALKSFQQKLLPMKCKC